MLPPRSAADVADVEITGLDASGIADVGLAAAGFDVSAFGIDRPEPVRRTTAALKPWSWGAGAIADPAARATEPRTTEMSAQRPPAVPHLGDDDRIGRGPALDRRIAPAPRAAVESTTADRVAADRFADADTDPGWLSATGRVAPVAAAAPAPAPTAAPGTTDPSADQPQTAVVGSLAALFTELPVAGPYMPHPAAPVDEPATEVHAALSTGELLRREEAVAASLHARHPLEHPDDGEDEAAHDLPLDHDDDHYDHDDDHYDDDHDDDRPAPARVFDETGGLEVIVAGSEGIDEHDDDLDDGGSGGGGRGRRGGGSGRTRKRRGPIAIGVSLLVLAALVAGIGVGGLALWRTINPMAKDYTGIGTGSVDVRVNDGDSLRTIAGTLVTADVIASSKPFETAAKANPAATGIQPGVYTLHKQMSGRSALDLLLDPASRVLSKVTIPEGMTAEQVLQRLSEQAGLPLDQLQAAVADPTELGLPAYANGQIEGFLFPATYDIEPGDTPVAVLSQLVAGTVRVLDDLQIPEDKRLSVLTEASIVQAEAGNVEDMGKVARVLDNRLADGMPLQLDTTVNYANGKSGITTTSADRQNPSPYNTYVHTGLPPGPISNPGEEALRAVLNPTPGDWRFFVVVNPDTGETRFAVTADEHTKNVLLFQQWLQDHPGN
jgi:UPF0755 protein